MGVGKIPEQRRQTTAAEDAPGDERPRVVVEDGKKVIVFPETVIRGDLCNPSLGFPVNPVFKGREFCSVGRGRRPPEGLSEAEAPGEITGVIDEAKKSGLPVELRIYLNGGIYNYLFVSYLGDVLGDLISEGVQVRLSLSMISPEGIITEMTEVIDPKDGQGMTEFFLAISEMKKGTEGFGEAPYELVTRDAVGHFATKDGILPVVLVFNGRPDPEAKAVEAKRALEELGIRTDLRVDTREESLLGRDKGIKTWVKVVTDTAYLMKLFAEGAGAKGVNELKALSETESPIWKTAAAMVLYDMDILSAVKTAFEDEIMNGIFKAEGGTYEYDSYFGVVQDGAVWMVDEYSIFSLLAVLADIGTEEAKREVANEVIAVLMAHGFDHFDLGKFFADIGLDNKILLDALFSNRFNENITTSYSYHGYRSKFSESTKYLFKDLTEEETDLAIRGINYWFSKGYEKGLDLFRIFAGFEDIRESELLAKWMLEYARKLPVNPDEHTIVDLPTVWLETVELLAKGVHLTTDDRITFIYRIIGGYPIGDLEQKSGVALALFKGLPLMTLSKDALLELMFLFVAERDFSRGEDIVGLMVKAFGVDIFTPIFVEAMSRASKSYAPFINYDFIYKAMDVVPVEYQKTIFLSLFGELKAFYEKFPKAFEDKEDSDIVFWSFWTNLYLKDNERSNLKWVLALSPKDRSEIYHQLALLSQGIKSDVNNQVMVTIRTSIDVDAVVASKDYGQGYAVLEAVSLSSTNYILRESKLDVPLRQMLDIRKKSLEESMPVLKGLLAYFLVRDVPSGSYQFLGEVAESLTVEQQRFVVDQLMSSGDNIKLNPDQIRLFVGGYSKSDIIGYLQLVRENAFVRHLSYTKMGLLMRPLFEYASDIEKGVEKPDENGKIVGQAQLLLVDMAASKELDIRVRRKALSSLRRILVVTGDKEILARVQKIASDQTDPLREPARKVLLRLKMFLSQNIDQQ